MEKPIPEYINEMTNYLNTYITEHDAAATGGHVAHEHVEFARRLNAYLKSEPSKDFYLNQPMVKIKVAQAALDAYFAGNSSGMGIFYRGGNSRLYRNIRTFVSACLDEYPETPLIEGFARDMVAFRGCGLPHTDRALTNAYYKRLAILLAKPEVKSALREGKFLEYLSDYDRRTNTFKGTFGDPLAPEREKVIAVAPPVRSDMHGDDACDPLYMRMHY